MARKLLSVNAQRLLVATTGGALGWYVSGGTDFGKNVMTMFIICLGVILPPPIVDRLVGRERLSILWIKEEDIEPSLDEYSVRNIMKTNRFFLPKVVHTEVALMTPEAANLPLQNVAWRDLQGRFYACHAKSERVVVVSRMNGAIYDALDFYANNEVDVTKIHPDTHSRVDWCKAIW